MAMLCHLLMIFVGFLGPLVIWLIQKDKSPFVDAHGRSALNFTISMFIYIIVLVIFAICGGLLIPASGGFSAFTFCFVWAAFIALVIFYLVITIMHCVEAHNGGFSPYPMAIEFFNNVDPYAQPPAQYPPGP